jgi:hypothetical protein
VTLLAVLLLPLLALPFGTGAAVGMWLLALGAAPFGVSFAFQRGAQKIFRGSQADAVLRDAMGITRWGIFGRLGIFPDPSADRSRLRTFLFGGPDPEQVVDIDTLRVN